MSVKLNNQIEEILDKVRVLYLNTNHGLSVEIAFDKIDERLRQIMNRPEATTSLIDVESIEKSAQNWYSVDLRLRINKLKSLLLVIEEGLTELKPSDIKYDPLEAIYEFDDETPDFKVKTSYQSRQGAFETVISELDYYKKFIASRLDDARLEYLSLLQDMEPFASLRIKKQYTLKSVYFFMQLLLRTILEDEDELPSKTAHVVANSFYKHGEKKPKAKSFLNNHWNSEEIQSTNYLLEDLDLTFEDIKREVREQKKKK